MVNYPAKLDNITTLPTVVDNLTAARAVTVNRLRDAILSVERALGINPAGGAGSVDSRFVSIENAITSGSNVIFGGDLSGTVTIQNVVGIQGNHVAATVPTNRQVLSWVGANNDWEPVSFTQDMIAPAYTITLSGGGFIEVSHSIANPAFTATYSDTPQTAVLTDSIASGPQNVISTPNSFSSVNTYFGNFFGSAITFTLTSSNGIATKTATTTLTWVQRSFYGIGPAGQSSAAFIQGLSGQFLTDTRSTTFSANATGTNHIYFACRAAYGAPTFSVGGFVGGFSLVSNTISVTNAFGFTENYQLWVSDNAGLGNTTVLVQ